MTFCPSCQRRRRVKTRLVAQQGKKYWISYCLDCETPLEVDGNDTRPDEKDQD